MFSGKFAAFLASCFWVWVSASPVALAADAYSGIWQGRFDGSVAGTCRVRISPNSSLSGRCGGHLLPSFRVKGVVSGHRVQFGIPGTKARFSGVLVSDERGAGRWSTGTLSGHWSIRKSPLPAVHRRG